MTPRGLLFIVHNQVNMWGGYFFFLLLGTQRNGIGFVWGHSLVGTEACETHGCECVRVFWVVGENKRMERRCVATFRE